MNWIGFSNPWMLAGLAAAGLPVLIHFLTRARPRPVVFPPFRFLIEACAGQQSLHRLRTILLLTLRCLALLALALLFTRPFLKPAGAASSPAVQRVVLVLDASFSMRAVQQGMPLFSRAQAEATDLLRSLEPGTEAGIVLAGRQPRALLPALSRNTAALHDALVRELPTYEAADPAAALALAKRMLGDAGTIYIFSDFQQSNWEGIGELPGGVLCRLRSVTTAPVENSAIIAMRAAPAAPVAGEPVEILATVLNSSPRPRQETVRLEIADTTQEARVSVPPFSSADAAFNVTFPRIGVFTGQAGIAPDDLRDDNTRYLALRVHKAMQLLVVSDADANDSRSAAFFVSHALAPSPQATPGLKLVRRHSQDTDRGILETADAFVIVAPATLSGEALEVITRRVNDGAQLLVFLDGANASALALPALSPPFQIMKLTTSAGGEPLRPGARKLFHDTEPNDWSTLHIHRHLQTQTLNGRSGDIVLAYADGSAALTLSSAGKGSVVFANLPLTPDATDLIGHPLFPSMLHELLRALRRGESAPATTPGTAWTLDVPGAGDAPLVVNDPEGRAVPAQVVSSGTTTRLAISPSPRPGIYVAKQNEALAAAEAVNIDPRESDTRPLALQKLKPGAGSVVAAIGSGDDWLVSGRNRPLAPELAAGAAFFFSAEMLLLAFWRPRRTRAMAAPGAEVRA